MELLVGSILPIYHHYDIIFCKSRTLLAPTKDCCKLQNLSAAIVDGVMLLGFGEPRGNNAAKREGLSNGLDEYPFRQRVVWHRSRLIFYDYRLYRVLFDH
jgi:hypothetical protein